MGQRVMALPLSHGHGQSQHIPQGCHGLAAAFMECDGLPPLLQSGSKLPHSKNGDDRIDPTRHSCYVAAKAGLD